MSHNQCVKLLHFYVDTHVIKNYADSWVQLAVCGCNSQRLDPWAATVRHDKQVEVWLLQELCVAQ